MKYKNIIFQIEHDPIIKEMFSALIALIPEIPALDELIDEATQNGPILVEFVSKDRVKSTGVWEQSYTNVNGIITMKRFIKVVTDDQTFADMIDTIVFELCNAKNPSFQLLSAKAIKPANYSTRDSYAFATELAEYTDTHLPARAILKRIFSNDQIVTALKIKGINITNQEIKELTSDPYFNFQDWWQHVNQNLPGRPYSHSDIYRQNYDKKMRLVVPSEPVIPASTEVQPLAVVPTVPTIPTTQPQHVKPGISALQKKLNLNLMPPTTNLPTQPPVTTTPSTEIVVESQPVETLPPVKTVRKLPPIPKRSPAVEPKPVCYQFTLTQQTLTRINVNGRIHTQVLTQTTIISGTTKDIQQTGMKSTDRKSAYN